MFNVEMKEQRLLTETHETYSELIYSLDYIVRYKERSSIGFINSHTILKISDNEYVLSIIYTEA